MSAAYVLALVMGHAFLPRTFVWELALFFLIAMLFTYPLAAIWQGNWVRREIAISATLAAIGVLGYVTSAWWIVAAIAMHGVYDLAKHRGLGARFFGWYTLGCAGVDLAYATTLGLYAWSLR